MHSCCDLQPPEGRVSEEDCGVERCRDDGNINSGSTSAGAAVNDGTPPPPPQLNSVEDLRRNTASHPRSPNFWEKFLPAGRHSKTIFRLHLMNFTYAVPGICSDISCSKYELYQQFQLDAVAQTATFCTL